MARTPRPWFRNNRGWFVSIDNRQHSLGVSDPLDEAAALAAMKVLLGKLKGKPADKTTTEEAVERYLGDSRGRVKPSTQAYYVRHLSEFIKGFSSRPVATVTPKEVEEFTRNKASWSSATKRHFLATVESLMRSAGATVATEHGEPGRWRTTKPKKTRSAVVVSDESYWQIRGATRGDFRSYLDTLWHTGARPGEIARLTVEQVNWPQALARIDEHKTDKDGRPRIIHFNEPAMAVLLKQREKYKTGRLFRNEAGGDLHPYQAGRHLWRIVQRLGVKASLYGYRHAFATRALAAGLPDAHVAELLGHCSTAMVHASYSHLGQMHGALKDSLKKMAG